MHGKAVSVHSLGRTFFGRPGKRGRRGGQMGGSKLVVGLGALTFAALLGLFLLFRPDGAQAIAQGNAGGATYVGVASCSGTTCHGRSEGDGPVVRQDEIMLWQDPASASGAHSRAHNVLREPRSHEARSAGS